jgi:hypothetical protein
MVMCEFKEVVINTEVRLERNQMKAKSRLYEKRVHLNHMMPRTSIDLDGKTMPASPGLCPQWDQLVWPCRLMPSYGRRPGPPSTRFST